MDFRKINSSVKVKFCSQEKCLQNTEYICQDCQKDFCFKCHKEHATSLDTKHHSITLYRNKGSHFPNKNETCSIHLDSIYQKYCEFCNIPICDKCKRHRKHKKLELLTAYSERTNIWHTKRYYLSVSSFIERDQRWCKTLSNREEEPWICNWCHVKEGKNFHGWSFNW